MNGGMLGRACRGGLRSGSATLFFVALTFAAPAFSQTPTDELARKHFDSAVAYLEENDLESALKAFEKSYALSRRPEILLNIATVQERRGELKAAVEALDRYLKLAPENERTPSVRERKAKLEKQLEPIPPIPVVAEPTEPFEPHLGPIVTGGLVLAPEQGAVAFRADAGFPLRTTTKTYLRLLLVLTFDHQDESGFEVWALAPFPTIQQGWVVLS